MSEVYIKEPATKGAAVLRTTHGDLEIELWATECPKACRNFCQLILEGYYNDSIFHRIIKDFIIQGGDKTNTGEGSESFYGEPYVDEIHPRLKFRYRGMMGVASAGAGSKTNGSQFFIVMNRAPSLDRKHTLFGKVVGQTIYNLVRLTEVEVDKHDRPVDPPRIIRAELTWDPFGDLEPRFSAPPMQISTKPTKHRREAIKNKKVLSFGDDGDDDSEDEAPAKFGKARSAHDVLNDKKLLKEAAYAASSAPSRSREEPKRKEKEAETKKRAAPKADSEEEADYGEAEAPSKSAGGKQAAPPAKAARRKAANSESDSGAEKKGSGDEKDSSAEEDDSSSDEAGAVVDKSQKRKSEMNRLKQDIASARKGEETKAPVSNKKKSAWEELLASFKTRGQKNVEKPKDKKGRQAQAAGDVKQIKSFKERVRDVGDEKEEDPEDPDVKARKEKAEEGSLAAVWDEGEEESTADWLNGGGLTFHMSENKRFTIDSSKAKETLEIFDPLLARNEKEVLEEARLRRSAQLKPSLRASGLSTQHRDRGPEFQKW